MEILYLLVPLSVVLVFVVGVVFWWSLKNGQFEDLEGPAHRILMDNDRVPMGEDGQGVASGGTQRNVDSDQGAPLKS